MTKHQILNTENNIMVSTWQDADEYFTGADVSPEEFIIQDFAKWEVSGIKTDLRYKINETYGYSFKLIEKANKIIKLMWDHKPSQCEYRIPTKPRSMRIDVNGKYSIIIGCTIVEE